MGVDFILVFSTKISQKILYMIILCMNRVDAQRLKRKLYARETLRDKKHKSI